MKNFKKEKTFVIIKPDGVQRSLVGEVTKRFERVGLKLIGVKMLVPTKEQVEKHYTIDSDWKIKAGEKAIKAYKEKGKKPPSEVPLELGEIILKSLKKYLTSGPVVTMVWQGAHAIAIVRKIVGGTEPLTSDVGTIRGDYVLDSYEMSDADGRSCRNILHASGSKEEAENEVNLWFKKEELIEYRLVQEMILYDTNLDGIFE